MNSNPLKLNNPEESLFDSIVLLIENSKKSLAIQANSELTMLFWQVGKHINDAILQNQRADYGKRIVPTLSTQLETHYGRNFEEKNLRRMMQFAEQFADFQIVVTLSRQLS
jgi:hypothetical protein